MSKFDCIRWIRSPQGGREDSPDGRFILWGDTGRYELYDNHELDDYRCQTLSQVQKIVRELSTPKLDQPPEDERRILAWLKRFV